MDGYGGYGLNDSYILMEELGPSLLSRFVDSNDYAIDEKPLLISSVAIIAIKMVYI